MNAYLEMDVSIEYQANRLAKKYKSEISSILKEEGDPEGLLRTLLDLCCRGNVGQPRYEEILSIYFALSGKYRLAWLTRVYLGESWNKYAIYSIEEKPVALDEPYLSDLRLLWRMFDTKKYPMDCYLTPNAYGACASPSSEVVSQEVLDKALGELTKAHGYESLKEESDKEWGDARLFFSFSPRARYAKCAETKEFHISRESMRRATFNYGWLLLANEKNLEAAEWLFRVRHILTRSCPAKGEYQPKLVQIASMGNCLDCWLLARLSQDAAQRRTLGWMSVYWLLENLWVSPEWDWSFPYPFAMFCGLVGEFDLLGGERQVEFQRHLKMFISFGCKSLAQTMLDDPMPVMGRKEMGGIPGVEVVPIYLRKYEEIKSKKR